MDNQLNDARIKYINQQVTVNGDAGHFTVDGVDAKCVIGIVIIDFYKMICITNHNSSFRAVSLTNSGCSVVSSGTKFTVRVFYVENLV